MSDNKRPKLLLADNNDSFTYNIVDCLRSVDGWDLEVIPSTRLEAGDLIRYEKIILSPGPGVPDDFPAMAMAIQHCAASNKALLGICLGHQAVGLFFGGALQQLPRPVHGQQKKINVDNNSALFKQLPPAVEVGLYHSWAISAESVPACLRITGSTNDGQVMAVQHISLPIYSVQFHPESFLTTYGKRILENFLHA